MGKTAKGTGGVTDSAYGVKWATATTEYAVKDGLYKTADARISLSIGCVAA